MLRRAAATAFSFLALTALLTTACGGDDDDDPTPSGSDPTATTATSNSGGEDVTISIGDNQFSPSDATVSSGQEVIWEWSGSNPHSVVGEYMGAAVESIKLTGSGTFVWSFAQAGTFEYECGVHGAAMSGTITIQ